MSRVTFSPICMVFTADITGVANLSVKVPGTFNGITDDKNGRFLKYVDIWTDIGTNGDRLSDLRIEDTDTILQNLGISTAAFPDYPILYQFQDQDLVETASLKRGLFLKDQLIHIERIDPRDPYDFIPSGFYLRATYINAAALGGQKVRVNVGWGKINS